ncbi:Integral ER membrane protein Scs2, putative [Penicillium digitatum]|uniref:Integral ER membrane protein Scs2, putative n=3 Tax=Penicillium digitatum TaxID=36651 RepID=K9GEJ7_PEND2|nr:Integral ER membrane protein Scs2, putative [Penicillium digitatum Pd1]EKV19632.1 Integral ER membrane protein Scs2, putative [Penicillium digitatum PHI26]EKV20740.1 Integral ER membrane protein Scs2, putative [Penicillium digitatum Pd1]KAG0156847.1 hypothetical protein PDIDSM_4029 [Penicillium digitatum]QQK44828.1 Integral ER membrane protein Scs2, putative [Penicillium digitatum]
MTIQIEPSELGFKRPFNHEVCQVLRLSNPNEESVVFKVKTTAPKHYCVRPNSGHIEPGKTVEVQVLLQAMKEDPAADAKCKDKFLVQAVPVSRSLEDASVAQIFDQTAKADVVERKIRVVFLPTDATSNDSVHHEELPAHPSPGGANFQTPAPKKIDSDETSPIPAPDFSEKPQSPQQEPAPAISNAKSSIANALPSSEELKSQLSEANVQIQRLKDRLAEQGLRQRKTGGETAGTAVPAAMQQSHVPAASGVSIQNVACLCLLSFLIAYFFF